MKCFLAIGPMPPDADPAEYYAAGPWCFCGQEQLFPDWEKRFTFAPEPLVKQNAITHACAQAQALSLKLIPLIVNELGWEFKGFPDPYWETLLMPWSIAIASQIVERFARVLAMREKWPQEKLVIKLLPEDTFFFFKDEADFNLRGMLGVTFNWWLFSRLLEFSHNGSWQFEYADPFNQEKEENASSGFISSLRSILRNLLLKLPFPPLKGVNIFESAIFSLALWHKCKKPSAAFSVKEVYGDPELTLSLPDTENLLKITRKAIPESLKNLKKHPAEKIHSKKPRLRIASIIAYENCAYRQKLAFWKAGGGRLGWVQHGGNYGQIKVSCNSAIVEYPDDVFFTWGWKKQGDIKGNFIPVPYPQLQKIRDKWHCENDTIIFTGTEMACFSYRLESRPTPLQFVRYRQAKARFLDACPEKIRSQILYRPYFPLRGLLEDAPWISRRFPEIGICKGPLLNQILHCKILLLDHHGTTMLEAMAANVPMILYWEKNAWPLTLQCERLLKNLEKNGIWHSSPESAAAKLLEVYDNPLEWWQSSAVQNCRNDYCNFQAWTLKSGSCKYWIKTLYNL